MMLKQFWSSVKGQVEPFRPQGLTDALVYSWAAALVAGIISCYFVYG